MDVLEPGQVPADHDQVQVLVVGGGVRGDRRPVGSEDPEPQRLRLRGRQLRRQRLQAVAVLGDLQPAGNLDRAGPRGGGGVLAAVGGALVPGGSGGGAAATWPPRMTLRTPRPARARTGSA
ncbi:hypothetical protein ACFQZ4_04685 [Catellatospora coxensis]